MQKFIIYGANRVAKDFMYIFGNILQIMGVIEDDSEKIGKDFCGRKVCSIEEYTNCDYLIVLCDFDKSSKIKRLEKEGLAYGVDYIFEKDLFSMLDNIRIPQDRKIAIWGYGNIGHEFLSNYNDIGIELIIDAHIDDGICMSPEMISDWKQLFVIITTIRNSEIRNRLEQLGLEYGKDFCFYHDYENQPSRLLSQTIFDKNSYDLECNTMLNHFEVLAEGNTACCCTTFVSNRMGSILQNDFRSVWTSIVHKILCLSSENRTYSFCNKTMCPLFSGQIASREYDLDRQYKEMEKDPKVVVLGFDKTCNLRCETCRKDYIFSSDSEKKINEKIVKEVQEYLLDKCYFLISAGDGEVFLSDQYWEINLDSRANKIPYVRLLTNGLLFSEKNWKKFKANKKGKILLTVSVDAAHSETYSEIRKGGNFSVLKRNMEFASMLRKRDELSYFRMNFVVQRKNYLEIPDFIKWAEELGCDEVFFTKIMNWGTYSDEEFEQISMMENDGETPKPEFQEIMNLPICSTPIVDWGTIKPIKGVVVDEAIENYYIWEMKRKRGDIFI